MKSLGRETLFRILCLPCSWKLIIYAGLVSNGHFWVQELAYPLFILRLPSLPQHLHAYKLILRRFAIPSSPLDPGTAIARV